MSTLAANQISVIQQTPANTKGEPRVDLVKKAFDAQIDLKGYDVYHDNCIFCPCRNVADSQALSSCKNCGGSGYVFYNRKITKMIFQSMNYDTKFKEWSTEKRGTVKITARNEADLAFMDRIVLKDSLMMQQKVLFPQVDTEGNWLAMSEYDFIRVEDAFFFNEEGLALQRAVEGTHFTIENKNWIKLNLANTFISDLIDKTDHPTITLRFQTHPAYHVVDFNRYIIDSKEKDDKGFEENHEYPISAIGRLAHYQLDQNSYNNDFLLDNSYVKDGCTTIYQPVCND